MTLAERTPRSRLHFWHSFGVPRNRHTTYTFDVAPDVFRGARAGDDEVLRMLYRLAVPDVWGVLQSRPARKSRSEHRNGHKTNPHKTDPHKIDPHEIESIIVAIFKAAFRDLPAIDHPEVFFDQLMRQARRRAKFFRIARGALRLRPIPPLDDLTRARMERQIIYTKGRPERHRRHTSKIWALGPVAAAVLLFVAIRPWPSSRGTTAEAFMPTRILRGGEPDHPAPLPYAASTGQTFERLRIPAGTTIESRLGTTHMLAIEGPADLRLLALHPHGVELTLSHGRLHMKAVTESERQIVIHAPDSRLRGRGEDFALAIEGMASRIAVRRGALSIERGGDHAIQLRAGETISSRDARPHDMDENGLALFDFASDALDR